MKLKTLPTFIDDLLKNSWEQICFLTYDGFTKNGRGTLAIIPDEESEAYLAEYVVYDLENISEDWAYIVREYNPETEFVLQFTDEVQDLRTIRIKTPENGQHPKRVWFFQALAETMDNPDTLVNRPQWFIDALNDLEKAKIKE